MILKHTLKIPTLLLMFFMSGSLFAQDLWQSIESSRVPNPGLRYIIPSDFKTYALDERRVEQILKEAPQENGTRENYLSASFNLPMPDGTMREYAIVNSPVMAPELAKKYPEIQSYAGYDLKNPSNTVRFDLTPHGFHAMAFTQEFGTVYIDPYSFQKKGYYIVYRKKDFQPIAGRELVCGVAGKPIDTGKFKQQRMMGTAYGDCTKRTYRLALAANGEYTAFHGGTVALALAAQVTTMNRINGIYMREMSIFMQIVANNDLIIYTDAATDPYSTNIGTMIGQVQTDCDAKIGTANYDIGHLLGAAPNNGLAGLGVLCLAGQKARGVTLSSPPVNDPFDVDYVAHEMGHQFGCNHTQNNNCNRNGPTAAEPGSASTIMGYAGICVPNVQNNSDDHFHGISMEEMSNTILNTGCAMLEAISNTTPIINSVTTSLSIPGGGTPFFMRADATDPEGDVMTYNWEQMNTETSTQPPVATSNSGPNFRSNSPVTSPTRYFPNLPDLTAGISPTWEVLAEVNRTYAFRVSVRDNFADGGCTTFEDATINVVGDSGPFLVTDPTSSGIVWPTGGIEAVTWDVAGTTDAPISCANVDILLSTDGGLTYPTTMASAVPNTGMFNVTVPSMPSTTCRVMIVCSDNVFFDISDQDFEIETSSADFSVTTNQNSAAVCQPDDASYTIDVTGINGFVDDITLSAVGLPSGATASFSPAIITGAVGSSTLTVTSTGVASGSYTITVEGTNGTETRMVDLVFVVQAEVPGDITLLDPVDGAIDVNQSASLTWNADADATSYELDIATDVGFTNIVESDVGISGTTYSTQNLVIMTTYYWRVRGSNICGEGNWSTPWSFTTDDIVGCVDFTTGPFIDFNPVPSACFNDCTPVSQTFEVYQNESYALYNLAGGEEYTFEFCAGYDPATWEALITVAELDAIADAAISGSEFASALGCSLTFSVPVTGDYVIIISDPSNCGGATVSVDNGLPTLTCTGMVSCCGTTFADAGGAEANYADALNYVTTICPDGLNEIIEVNFSAFSIEEDGLGGCYDFLTIYDGDNTSAPQIGGDYCDVSGSPGIVTATGPTGCLTFEFISDRSVVQAGWLASVTCILNCPDSDEDGICDADDQCPGENDGIIGTACDDGDDCTIDDEYDTVCDCVGTALPDLDMDGVCDDQDNCPGDPNPGQEDNDMNGVGDACDCLIDVILTAGQSSGSVLIEASNNITSSELISGNAQVEYSAGTDIDLEFPFEVVSGAELHAYILGCDNGN